MEDSKIATIRLTGVKSNIYRRIIEAIKCHMTISPVACIRLVMDVTNFCLLAENIVLNVKYRLET